MRAIGENIAELRKKKGMTQEALAAVIGVSAQSVSKWENGTNLPDIALLPMLADIFEVDMDRLFGRGMLNSCNADQALETGCEALVSVISRVVYGLSRERAEFEEMEPFDEYRSEIRTYLKQYDDARTAVFRSHGELYYREKLGGLLLKKPEEGWSSLLKSEEAVRTLEMLCCKDFRNALAEIIKSRKTMYTIGTICLKCKIEDVDALKEKFRESSMFKTFEVEVDGRAVELYELSLSEGRLVMLYAMLAFADEYAKYKDNYYCNAGCYREDLMG